MNNLRKSLCFIFALIAYGMTAWAQNTPGNHPAEVRAEDATITELGHATMTVEMKIVTDSLTRRTDTLFETKNIEWHTDPGTAKRRNAERDRSNGSDFYNGDSNWWLDLYWYNFNYPSINAEGETVMLSALACMPDEDCDYINNVIIGCHVTITSNKECPSSYTDEGNSKTDVGLLMNHAGSGLVLHSTQSDMPYYNLVIMPDYEGYGITRSHAHPYLYQELTARQVVDGVRYGIALYKNSSMVSSIRHPFRSGWRSICVGYSQGGSVAMATHRFIEQNGLTDELQFAGSVCGDGPYDPVATLMYYVKQYNENKPMSMPVVLPLILKGMCDWNPYMKNHQVSDYLTESFLASGILGWLNEKEKTTDDITAAWKTHFGDNWPLKLNNVINQTGLSFFQTLYTANSSTYTSTTGVPLPTQRGLMQDLQFALASNNLTKGWTPQHAMFLYHSYDDSVVPEDNRESAGNSFGEWVIKLHASGAGQYDHVGTGRQFFLGLAEFAAIRQLAKAPVHQTMQNAIDMKNDITVYGYTLDPWDNPPVINNGIVIDSVALNGNNIAAEFLIKDGNAYLGTGNNACISQYSEGKVEVPATITVNNTTYPVTKVSAMAFRMCTQITEVVLPANITRIGDFAFKGCRELSKVSLPSTLTSIGTGAFIDLPNLVRIDCHATTPPVWEYNDVFKFHTGGIDDNATYSYDISLFVPSESMETYQSSLFTNSGIGWTTADGWGHFNYFFDTFDENAEAYTEYKDGHLTFYYDANKSARTGDTYYLNASNELPDWVYEHQYDITSVSFSPSFSYARPDNTSMWFRGCSNLETISGWDYLWTDDVLHTNAMFYGCSQLTDEALDLSNFNTSSVQTMNRMFYGCSSLVHPDVSLFDTRACTEFEQMFENCTGIVALDVSAFTVANTDYQKLFERMFKGCTSLEHLNISSLIFKDNDFYDNLFYNCEQLKTLVLPTTLFSEVRGCFAGCSAMEDVYYNGYDVFSEWNTQATDFAPNKATRFHVLANRLSAWTSAYPDANVTFVGDLGTEDNPIMIYGPGDWENLDNLTQHDQTIYAKLMNDLTVYSTVGSNDHPFTGVFDGNGNMLTAFLEFNATENPIEVAAPFRAIRNATIKNLVMDGTIMTSGEYFIASGLVGLCRADGTNTVQNYITNCHVTNTITGNITLLSGIIGWCGNIGGTINENSDYIHNTITGCLFDGRLISTSTPSVAGAISCGFEQINNHVVTDCVESAIDYQVTNGFMFCGKPSDGGQHTSTTNCYYTFNASVNGHEMEVGNTNTKKAHSITTQTENLELNFGTPTTHYDVSQLEFYKSNGIGGNNGVRFYDYYFAGEGDHAYVTVCAPGYDFDLDQISVTGAAFQYIGNDSYDITMGTSDVVINVPITFTTVILEDDSFTNSLVLNDFVDETYKVKLQGHRLERIPEWNTLCLPFDLPSLTGTPLAGATLKVIDTITFENKVAVFHFKNATSISADRPYLVKMHNVVSDLTFNNVTIKRSLPPGMKIEVGENTSKGFAIIGNYNYMDGVEFNEIEDLYTALYLDGTQLKKARTSTNFNAFQVFFEVLEMTDDEVAAVVLDIEDDDNIFTVLDGNIVGIDNIFVHDGDWNDADNWAKEMVPNESHKVLIEGQATIPADCLAKADEITIDAGSITIVDGGQLVHSNAGVVATVEKSITGHGGNNNGGWNFIATPIATGTTPSTDNGLLDATPENYDLYYYHEETHKWRNYKGTAIDENHADPGFILNNGQGYLYANQATTTLSFTGALQAGDNGTYTMNNLSHCATELTGFNLVGNPFACNATIDRPAYVINGRNVVAYSGDQIVLAPCEGVIVQADAEHESVTFSKVIPDAQSPQPNAGSLHIALSQVVEPVETPVNRGDGPSTSSGTLALDNAIVSFTEGNELGKFYFDEQNANIYIPQDGKKYAIACVGRDVARYVSTEANEMPINFKVKQDGTYTLTVNPEGVEMAYLHLIDNMTGADIDLLQTPSYTFTGKTTDYESRFKLVFSTNETDGPSTGSGTFAFISNGNIIVNGEGTLQVIDMLGRQLSSQEIHSAFYIQHSAFAPGVYVLRLINGDNVKTQKMVIE